MFTTFKQITGISKKLDKVIRTINAEYSAGIRHNQQVNIYQICVFDAEGNQIFVTGGMQKHELSAYIEQMPQTFDKELEEFQELLKRLG